MKWCDHWRGESGSLLQADRVFAIHTKLCRCMARDEVVLELIEKSSRAVGRRTPCEDATQPLDRSLLNTQEKMSGAIRYTSSLGRAECRRLQAACPEALTLHPTHQKSSDTKESRVGQNNANPHGLFMDEGRTMNRLKKIT